MKSLNPQKCTLGLISAFLLGSICLVACATSVSKESTKKTEPTVVSKETPTEKASTQEEKLTLEEKFTINPDLVMYSDETPYEVPDNLDQYIGTYKGLPSKENNIEYDLNIQKDGTYTLLKQSRVGDSYDPQTVYFDRSGNFQQRKENWDFNSEYSHMTQIERGVIVEKFGKLNLVGLSYLHSGSSIIQPFTNRDGAYDAEKHSKLILSGMFRDSIYEHMIPQNQEEIDSFFEEFKDVNEPEYDEDDEELSFLELYYSQKIREDKIKSTEAYILDGQVTIKDTVLTKSQDVSMLVRDDLLKLISVENLHNFVQDENDLLQLLISSDVELKNPRIFKDYQNVYWENGDVADITIGLLTENRGYDTITLYAYYEGNIYSAVEDKGTYILREFN